MKRALSLGGLFAALLLYPAFPVFAADGFGQSTTGGAGGAVVTVDSNAILFKSYVESTSPYIVQVTGVLDFNSLSTSTSEKKVRIRSNKTIKGISPGAKIIGNLGFSTDACNVIIERLTITNPSAYGEGDGISIKENITNVFVTKCTFYDCSDGCLDITRASDYVTVSWCKFYYVLQPDHRNVNLIGAGDGHTGDMGKLHVTFHHNWWSNLCNERMPSVRFGRAHIYNNDYNCPGNLYCVRTRLYAECLVENNYFKNVQNPWERYVTIAGDLGKLHAAGNALVNVTWNSTYDPGKVFLIDGNDVVFEPNYSYTLDDANDIPAMVQSGAGADGNDFFPHWLFGPYGDFDRSGTVNMKDFEQFVDNYWLVEDEEQIADADYNGDGIVNFYEFALLAQNWSGN
jgi:pectate lyase